MFSRPGADLDIHFTCPAGHHFSDVSCAWAGPGAKANLVLKKSLPIVPSPKTCLNSLTAKKGIKEMNTTRAPASHS